MHHELIKYINPILSSLISITFAILLVLLKGRRQVNEEDEKGLNPFILAFVIFAIVGIIECCTIEDFESIWLKIVKVIFSTINSCLIIIAMTSIHIKHQGISSFLKNKLLFVFIGILALVIILMTIYIGSTNKIENIWFADNIFSVLSIFCLGIVMMQAFTERNMKMFKWIVVMMLLSILVTQILKLEGFISMPEESRIFISTISSVFYKTLFCILLLLLLFSYQIMQYIELTNKNQELNDSNLLLEEEILKKDDFINEPSDEYLPESTTQLIKKPDIAEGITQLTEVEMDVLRIMFKHPSKSSLTFISQKLNRPLPTIVSQIKNIKRKLGFIHKNEIIEFLQTEGPMKNKIAESLLE